MKSSYLIIVRVPRRTAYFTGALGRNQARVGLVQRATRRDDAVGEKRNIGRGRRDESNVAAVDIDHAATTGMGGLSEQEYNKAEQE
jgi:hypothetical protein